MFGARTYFVGINYGELLRNHLAVNGGRWPSETEYAVMIGFAMSMADMTITCMGQQVTHEWEIASNPKPAGDK